METTGCDACDAKQKETGDRVAVCDKCLKESEETE